MGFRGLHHLVTSGSTAGVAKLTGSFGQETDAQRASVGISTDSGPKRIVQPPVPFRDNIAQGLLPRKFANASLTWGVQFELKDSLTEPNKKDRKSVV